jgi:hypothetical protein
MRTLMMVVVVAAIFQQAPTAGGAVVCATKKGSLALRDACKRKESAVDLFPLVRDVVVRDATGALVGPVVDVGPRVLLRVGGSLLIVTVDASGFPDGTFFSLTFESIDCTGQPLLPEPAASLVATPMVRGGVMYYPTGVPTNHPFGSSLSTPLTPGMCFGGTLQPGGLCCFPAPVATTSPAVPAAQIPVGSLGFSAPFSIEGP